MIICKKNDHLSKNKIYSGLYHNKTHVMDIYQLQERL